MAHCTTTYDHNNEAHRTLPAWRNDAPDGNWLAEARRYALAHGEAKVWKADGVVMRFWRDEGRVRQRTYRCSVHVR
jgi:hypothetical protein